MVGNQIRSREEEGVTKDGWWVVYSGKMEKRLKWKDERVARRSCRDIQKTSVCEIYR
jgi:hypothetical protein